MIPKNPLDAILAEVLGDDGGLLLAGNWLEEAEGEEEPYGPDDEETSPLLIDALSR